MQNTLIFGKSESGKTTGYMFNQIKKALEKEEKMPDGLIKRYSKSFYNKNPELGIRLQDKNHKNSIDVAFDSQNVVKNIDVQKEIGNTSYSKYIKFNKIETFIFGFRSIFWTQKSEVFKQFVVQVAHILLVLNN